MEQLSSWLSSLDETCPGESGVTLKVAKGCLARGLTASAASLEGTALLRVPWAAALTADTALIRLKQLEEAGSGLLPRGLQHFVQIPERKPDILPGSCAWTSLLALQLLAEMRDAGTTLLPYIQLLPSPPGTLTKAVCSKGPDASDLLLFSLPELLELQVVPVWAAVLKEQQRLRHLHQVLFCSAASGAKISPPAISLESFIWAHCLVRSRVLELCHERPPPQAPPSSLPAELGGLQLPAQLRDRQDSTRCMLPLIDLCNHAPRGQDTCKLGLQTNPDRSVRAVTLDAKRPIEKGSALTLDYGHRPMRDMLRNYGFCADSAFEVFEEVGDTGWSLIVQGVSDASCFRLAEVHIYAAGEGNPLLEMAGASMCFMVSDGTCAHGHRDWAAAPKTVLHICQSPDSSLERGHSWACAGGTMVDSTEAGHRALQPEQEAALASFLARECQHALAAFATNCAEDEASLRIRAGAMGSQTNDVEVEATTGTTARESTLLKSKGGRQVEPPCNWLHHANSALALQWRLQHKRLLLKVSEDLQMQSQLWNWM